MVGDVANPGTAWTQASISLGVDGGWHIGTIDGALATKKQIAAVLENATQLQIRAEHVSGSETGGLDNVTLSSRPSPDHPSAAVFDDDRGPGHHANVFSLPHHAFEAAVHTILA